MAACVTQADASKSHMEPYLMLTEIKLSILSYFSCIDAQNSIIHGQPQLLNSDNSLESIEKRYFLF